MSRELRNYALVFLSFKSMASSVPSMMVLARSEFWFSVLSLIMRVIRSMQRLNSRPKRRLDCFVSLCTKMLFE